MSIPTQLQKIRQQLPKSVKLMVVTKKRSIDEIKEVIRNNVKILGENRLLEAKEKIPHLPKNIEKHFIGHLQTNKVSGVVQYFDVIQSVDRFKLARKIEAVCTKLNKVMPIFIQVNTSNEIQKGGVSAEEAPLLIQQVQSLKHVKIIGLMTMAMQTKDSDKIRTCFRKLKNLLTQIKEDSSIDSSSINELSMGMSNDYLIAAEEGSTMVRIGSQIFK